MSETRTAYMIDANLLQSRDKQCTMDTELQVVRVELVELERRLIAALVTVQHALGKEPSIVTRAERRKR
jgi:hypothetical protein